MTTHPSGWTVQDDGTWAPAPRAAAFAGNGVSPAFAHADHTHASSGGGSGTFPFINAVATPYNVTAGGSVSSNVTGLQAAIDAAAVLGNTVILPPGTIDLNAQINMKANVTLAGCGMNATILKSSVTGNATFASITAPADVIRMTSPINSSVAVHTQIRDLTLWATNGAMTGGCYDDIDGTFVIVQRVLCLGGKYGIIFDQTELADILDCDIEAQSHSGIWLVNAADHVSGALGGLTNRISIQRCQLNVPTQAGIWDDGGNNHEIRDCNFNGGTYSARLAGIFSGQLVGCELEGATGSSAVITAVTSRDGNGVGPVRQFAFINNELTGGSSSVVDLIQGTNIVSFNNSIVGGASVGYSNVGNVFGFTSIGDHKTGAGALIDANPLSGLVLNSQDSVGFEGLRLLNTPLVHGVKTQTLSSNGAVTIDASAGDIQPITLAANATSSSITNATVGQVLTIEWIQDATGARTYVWPTNVAFAGEAVPAASVTAGRHDSVTFRYDGTNWIEMARAVDVFSAVTDQPFSTFTGTTANGDPWKLYVPNFVSGVNSTPLVHYFHPYGEDRLGLDLPNPGNVLLQPWMNAGFCVVVGEYSHGVPVATNEAWGAPVIASGNARAVETCFNQIDAQVRSTRSWLGNNLVYAASMGGLNALDAFRYETGITNVKGLFMACGCFDLADMYAGAHTGHINTAYNIPTGGTYAAQTSGRDPALATAAQNVGPTTVKRFRYSFSCGDEVVHPDAHGKTFITKMAGVSGLVENSAIVAPDNNVHLAGNAYAPADSVAFFKRALNGDATAPAVPAAPVVVTGSVTSSGAQVAWKYPSSVSANLAGWHVFLDGVQQGGLITSDLTGAWLHADGNTSTNTSWTTSGTPFTAWMAQVGQVMFGDGMQQGTTIATFNSSSSVTLSAATTVTDNLNRLRYVVPSTTISTFSGLAASTTYTITLKAVSIDGVESAASASVQFTTSAAAVGPSKVQSASSLSAGATTSRTATLGATATNGNLLVAFFVTRNDTDGTVAAPSGWTQVVAPPDMHFTGQVFMCYKVSNGTETNITFSWTTSSLSELLIQEWAGTTASPLDTTTVTSSGDLGTGPFTTVTGTESAIPTVAHSVSFMLVGTNGSTGTISAPSSGWTHEVADESTDNVGIIASSRVFTSTPGSAPTDTETWTTGQRAAWIIAGFKGT